MVRFVNMVLRRGCVALTLVCVEQTSVCALVCVKLRCVNAGMCKSCTHCVEAVLRNLIVGALLLLQMSGRHAMLGG